MKTHANELRWHCFCSYDQPNGRRSECLLQMLTQNLQAQETDSPTVQPSAQCNTVLHWLTGSVVPMAEMAIGHCHLILFTLYHLLLVLRPVWHWAAGKVGKLKKQPCRLVRVSTRDDWVDIMKAVNGIRWIPGTTISIVGRNC